MHVIFYIVLMSKLRQTEMNILKILSSIDFNPASLDVQCSAASFMKDEDLRPNRS